MQQLRINTRMPLACSTKNSRGKKIGKKFGNLRKKLETLIRTRSHHCIYCKLLLPIRQCMRTFRGENLCFRDQGCETENRSSRFQKKNQFLFSKKRAFRAPADDREICWTGSKETTFSKTASKETPAGVGGILALTGSGPHKFCC